MQLCMANAGAVIYERPSGDGGNCGCGHRSRNRCPEVDVGQENILATQSVSKIMSILLNWSQTEQELRGEDAKVPISHSEVWPKYNFVSHTINLGRPASECVWMWHGQRLAKPTQFASAGNLLV